MSSFFNPIGLVGENAFNLRSGDFFPSEQATAALRRLKALLELGGFGVLVGEPGVGKSTLLDHLVRECVDPNRYRVARVDFTNLSSGGFLRQLVFAFGDKPRRSKSDVVHQLASLWSRLAQTVLLIVDESDHLEAEALEDLPPTPAPRSLPETAWTDWARLYRRAVGDSTEAADEFHYLALLTVLATAFGRNLVLHCGRPIYPNMYTVLVGPTGDRKSTAAQLAMELLAQVAPQALVLNGLGSQEGLMERMAQAEPGRHRTLLSVDELASFLKKARRESSGSLLEFVTEIFHCPDFKTHSTRSRAIHLELPTLSILAGSTPVWLEAALQQEDILGGFANRFVYVAASPKPDNPLPARPDQQALADLVSWVRRATGAPSREIGWSSSARRLWCDFYVDWRRSTDGAGEQVVALLRRIDLYILKFASMAAAMDGSLEIAPAHLTSAIELGRFLAGSACRLLGDS